MSTIATKFIELRQKDRAGLILYFTVGFPSVAETIELVQTAVAAGADMIELGVPFSDPLADGATVQRSSSYALDKGVNVETCLETVRQLRTKGVSVPILLMGYYNPVFSYGCARFATDAVAAGVDGLIVPDLPPEESGELHEVCGQHGLDLIFFLSPTSTAARMAGVIGQASGFIYCVALTGVTGARAAVSRNLEPFLASVRSKTDLPLAVGFGISQPAHVAAVANMADAAIVGSSLIECIERANPGERVEAVRSYVAELVAATSKEVSLKK